MIIVLHILKDPLHSKGVGTLTISNYSNGGRGTIQTFISTYTYVDETDDWPRITYEADFRKIS